MKTSVARILRRAEVAQASFLETTSTAKKLALEREDLLSKALTYVGKVSEAIRIIELSESRDTSALAWKKAIVLLGTTAKSLPDLVLIRCCKFRATIKEDDFGNDLTEKEELILATASDLELLSQLRQINDRRYEKKWRSCFRELARQTSSLEDLEELCCRYGRHEVYFDFVDSIRIENTKRLEAERLGAGGGQW